MSLNIYTNLLAKAKAAAEKKAAPEKTAKSDDSAAKKVGLSFLDTKI